MFKCNFVSNYDVYVLCVGNVNLYPLVISSEYKIPY